MTSIPDFKPTVTAVAPAGLAIVSIIVGLFVPFIGLPLAMVSVVAIAAANIRQRRLLYVTVGIVAVAIAANLALVLIALPAGQQLVSGS